MTIDLCSVYDVASRPTFDEMVKWFREIETYCGEDVAKIIVGNKVDKVSTARPPNVRVVSP